MKRSKFLRNKSNPSTEVLLGHYLRKWDDIGLLPKTIDVVDAFLDEKTDLVMIKYITDYGEAYTAKLDYLSNYCRTEKEKRNELFKKWQHLGR